METIEPRDPRRPSLPTVLGTLGALGVLASAAFVAWTAADLAGDEQVQRLAATPFSRLRQHPESSAMSTHLLRLETRGTRRVDVTVCLERSDRSWRAGEIEGLFDVVLWRPAEQRLLSRARARASRAILDAKTVCLPMIDARITGDGVGSLDLAWTGRAPDGRLARSRVAARVVSWRPLVAADATAVLLLALALVACAVPWAIGSPPNDAPDRGTTMGRGLAAASMGFVLLTGSSVIATGALRVLVAALVSVVVVAVSAWIVAGRERRSAMGLRRPPGWAWVVAPIVGILVGVASSALTRLLPGSGVSVVEHAIALPSGRIATAGAALLAPIAEEVIFRGALYAALRRFGVAAAVAGSSVLFALVHVPQLEGAWGALAGVALAGLGFAIVRASMRSLWAALVAHWSYNAALVALGIWSDLGG